MSVARFPSFFPSYTLSANPPSQNKDWNGNYEDAKIAFIASFRFVVGRVSLDFTKTTS